MFKNGKWLRTLESNLVAHQDRPTAKAWMAIDPSRLFHGSLPRAKPPYAVASLDPKLELESDQGAKRRSPRVACSQCD